MGCGDRRVVSLTEGLLGELYHKTDEAFDFVQIVIIIGFTYVMFLAPYALLNGKPRLRDLPAALIGIGCWSYAALEIARLLG